MTIKIKNFGSDCACDNLGELKEKLRSEYSGKYISIVTKQKSGLEKVIMVTVDRAGGISYSHSGKKINPEVFFS
jgi:ribulose bisphosphate carboxylase small subunit